MSTGAAPKMPIGMQSLLEMDFEPNADIYGHAEFRDMLQIASKRGTGSISTSTPMLYRKPWENSRSENQKARDRELMRTLLTPRSSAHEGLDVTPSVETLIELNACLKDFRSLTDKDLQLLGISKDKHREELLQFFKQLPNQALTYDDICALRQAQEFNNRILQMTTKQLRNMSNYLALNSCNVKVHTPEDVLVGDKSFASRFAIEALAEVKEAVKEIEHEGKGIEDLLGKSDGAFSEKKTPSTFNLTSLLILISALATGLFAGWCALKLR